MANSKCYNNDVIEVGQVRIGRLGVGVKVPEYTYIVVKRTILTCTVYLVEFKRYVTLSIYDLAEDTIVKSYMDVEKVRALYG